jgi:2-methylcitrate dehydratase
LDGNALRTYRHFPNTGSRKSWAAGDAASRAVFLLRLAEKGEMGYPKVLTAKNWGFYDTVLGGKEMILEQPFASYVMDNILFKISFPAEFHAQTAVEAAISLHKKVINRLDEILEIRIRTHESAIRIIDKKGPLNNPADRDHCIQYMVAVGLIFGRLQANDYEDSVAQDPRIDKIREKITCFEDTRFTRDYLDPNKRSIANGVEIQFQNGTKLEEVIVEYPLGHKKRRLEGKPFLIQKFKDNMSDHFSKEQIEELVDFFENINEVKHKHTDFLLDKLWRG